MRRLQRVAVTAVAVMATLASTGPGAFAAGGGAVTREQFVYDLDRAIALQPVTPATPDFTDVSSTTPYYGYIEAAYQKGYIQGLGNGKFGPTQPLTRAQLAKIEVTALGDTSQANALMSQASTFKDDALIPSWARGYVLEAVQLGLVKGYPSGNFVPGANITSSDEAAFIRQFAVVLNAGSSSGSGTAAAIDVTASTNLAAVGQMVQLSAVVKSASGTVITSAPVSYTTTGSNVILSGSSFIASAPGVYTVQATSGSLSGIVTIKVYGTPAAIKLVSSGPVVADGQSTVTLKAEIVDGYGNVVANAQGNVALFYMSHGGATSIVAPSGSDVVPTDVTSAIADGAAASVNQGIATFTLQAGLVPGLNDMFDATMYNSSGSAIATPTAAQTTLTSVSETATSIEVQAPQFLTADVATQTTATIQVLDQAGEPMLFGAVPLTVALQGPATFANGSTGQQGYLFSGSGSPTNPASVSVPIESIQSRTGQVTLTATATGLPAQSAQITAVIAGPATAIKVTPPATTSFSESAWSTGLKFGVAVVDGHGYPTSADQTIGIKVERNGVVATNIKIDGYTQSSSGVLDNGALSAGNFLVTDTASGADAGNYTITVTDPNNKLQAAEPVSFTETPGQVAKVSVTAPSYIPLSSPTFNISASLEDTYGNVVPASGTLVDFANAPGNQAPGVTLSATSVATQDGVATVQASVPVYVGVSYTVDVSGAGLGAQPATFTVENTVAGNLTVGFQDTYQGADSSGQYATQHSKTTAEASDTVQILIAAVDQYGNPVQNEANSTVTIQLSGTGLVPEYSTGGTLSPIGTDEWSTTLTAQGTVSITAIAQTAGTVGVTVTDTSIAGGSTGAGDFTVVPGRFWGYQVLDSLGNNTATNNESVLANTPVELTVTPEDEYGNETTLTTAQTVRVSDSSNGTFSLAQGGPPITSFVLPAGQAQQVIYYQNPVAGSYHITAY